MTPPTMLELADEIEASDGIYLMGVKRQLGIRKTAQVIAALRSSQNGERERVIEDAAFEKAAKAAERYCGGPPEDAPYTMPTTIAKAIRALKSGKEGS